MTFNATTLEKELRPIKEEMARQRKLGKTPQVDPQALMGLQQRISSQVQDKYGVTDEQAAVKHYNHNPSPNPKPNPNPSPNPNPNPNPNPSQVGDGWRTPRGRRGCGRG